LNHFNFCSLLHF